MAKRTNPFQPNSPVNPVMFVGRSDELLALEQALVQTRAGDPKHFMVTGERGIGKTSVLNYLRWVAQGQGDVNGDRFNFLVINVDIERSTTPSSLARKVERALRDELAKTETARTFLAKTWNFLTRFEAAGIAVREATSAASSEDLLDELAYSLAQTSERICDSSSKATPFCARYQGVLLCIDEADRSPRDLQLGALLKVLTERLQRRGCDKLAIGLAGLLDLRDVLRESHPSSLRIFDEVQLRRLNPFEMSLVITRCLKKANDTNEMKTTIADDARTTLKGLSEGYPHFIQQFGYSAFATDSDGVIDQDDVKDGAFAERGAIELIGDRYYRDDFYNKIQQESYRSVLRIMADKLDSWISKDEIRQRFKGEESTLSNAIKALRDRHIILAKEGTKGVYRLQHKGFAWWILLYTSDKGGDGGQRFFLDTESH